MIHKVEVNGEKIYLKKNFLFGWGIINPIKNEDGSINWKNLICGGSWFKLIVLGFIILIILGAVYEYSMAVSMANECLSKNPLMIFP